VLLNNSDSTFLAHPTQLIAGALSLELAASPEANDPIAD